MSPAADPGGDALRDRRWGGTAFPVTSPFRPQQRLEAEALDQPQAGEAEGSVWWPIETRRQACSDGDCIDRPARVVGEQPAAPLAACLVAVAMEPDLMACSRDLADERRVARGLLAADEERRAHVKPSEFDEHSRRPQRVRTVVEGERHASLASERRPDTEHRCHPWEEGCRRRRPLHNGAAACGDRERPLGQAECRSEPRRRTDETARVARFRPRIEARR